MKVEEFIIEVKKLGIDLTDEMLEKFDIYYNMLIEKNKVMNLTRIIDREDAYLKHFYDSLTITKVINLDKDLELCDIGSGAGFPGIVLKICFPKLKITLIDSLNKRINFLKEVINKLELANIEAIHTRSEDFCINNKEKYDIVTSRAVANLSKLSMISVPLVKKGGYFIPMKANVDDEIKEASGILSKLNCDIEKKCTFHLKDNENLRNILLINKK